MDPWLLQLWQQVLQLAWLGLSSPLLLPLILVSLLEPILLSSPRHHQLLTYQNDLEGPSLEQLMGEGHQKHPHPNHQDCNLF
jgi:hypothetical protein